MYPDYIAAINRLDDNVGKLVKKLNPRPLPGAAPAGSGPLLLPAAPLSKSRTGVIDCNYLFFLIIE